MTMPNVTQPAPSDQQAPSASQQTQAGTRPVYSSVTLRYLEKSPILVRGPVTDQQYEFSGARPVQSVDARDAAALLRTRFFRPA
jgi:hypothetical protein